MYVCAMTGLERIVVTKLASDILIEEKICAVGSVVSVAEKPATQTCFFLITLS